MNIWMNWEPIRECICDNAHRQKIQIAHSGQNNKPLGAVQILQGVFPRCGEVLRLG